MTTWSTVDCVEVHGTRRETRNLTAGPGGFVSLQCDYADRNALSEDLMTNGSWPGTPAGKSAPKVINVTITPLPTDYTEDGQAIGYKTAQLDVQYGFDNSAGDSSSGGGSGSGRQYYTESFEPEMEVISLQDREYYYKTIGGLVHVPLGKKNIPFFRDYTFSIQRTYYNWVYVPASFKDLTGHINNATVTFPTLNLSFIEKTLLFVPMNATRSISSEGTAGFTVSVKFKYRELGWNRFPSKVGWYEDIFYKDDDGDEQPLTPYPLGDFSGWIF